MHPASENLTTLHPTNAHLNAVHPTNTHRAAVHPTLAELLVAQDTPDVTPQDIQQRAQSLVEAARRAQKTLGTAESLTGGLICATITSIAGSSHVVLGGIVSYAPLIKQQLLGVTATTIEKSGVVSDACALEMAQGARKALGCDVAVAVTGIAGPSGDETGKPIGTVYFGLATAETTHTTMRVFPGSRSDVRASTCSLAIDLLHAALV